MSTLTSRVFRFSLRQIIAIALIAVMSSLWVPPSSESALLQTVDASVRAGGSQILGWLVSMLGEVDSQASGGSNRNRKGVRPDPPLSKAEREARVAAIELNVTGEIVLVSRQPLLLSAIPLDQDGRTIHGIRAKWDSSNKRVIFVRKSGEAVAGLPGEATVTARVGSKTATARVRVVEGTKEPFGGKKRVDSTRNSQQQAVLRRTRLNNNTVVAEKMTTRQKRAHAIAQLARLPGAIPFIRAPNDDPLPDNETSSLYQTNNLIGTPPGKKKPGALTAAASLAVTESGNKNFSFGLPVIALDGRRIDVSLALRYNSLLWNKSTNPSNGSTWMTYDVDSGYPAQGFRLGYGQIEDQGSAGFTLTDGDGTRHALVFSSTNNYDTNDGTFMHFTGGSGWGTLFYPEGTQVTYGAAGGGYRSYPTKITDRNGNYILISYVNNVGPRINTIQDTLGRYVRFYYDSNNDLVTITMPGLTGQSDLQVMRFYYDTLTLPSGLFASSINVDKPATARVLKYVYLPASAEGTSSSSGDVGYRFDYSAYGMIYQIVKFHGMTGSTTSTSSTGTVSEGSNTIAATTTYDYYTSASSLSDAPTFAHRTDEWAGRTGGGSAPQYSFAVSEGTSEITSTVTAPDNTVAVTLSIRNPGVWDDGLIKETRIQNSSSVVFSKTVFAWEQNSTNGTPRVASIKVTNEAGKTRATVFTYDSSTAFNNVFRVSERDFTSDGSISSTELRKTETTYVTSSNYISRHLLHLPSMVQIFASGASTPASRVDYAYDNYGTSHANLTSRDDIIMHDPAFDPFQEPQETWDWVCTEYGYNESGFYTCLNWEWQLVWYYNPYDSTTDYRGNVTTITTYPDTGNTSNTITHFSKYDIAGNVISEDVDCCQTQSFTYSSANDDYAYPVSITKGNPSGLHLTSNISYDMNTGLVASTTDPNGRVTYFAYNIDSLRTDHIDFPDGGQISYDYGNALAADSAGRYHSHVVATSKLDSSRYVDSKSYFDGRGGLTQTYSSYTSGDGWSITDTEYDSMGRAYRVSNPYYCTSSYGTCSINPSSIWTTRTFDNLGRTTQITMPRGDDANPSYTTTVQTTYEGEVTTMTDQANKQRRLVTDALGRVIKVHEPTSSGLGTLGSPNQETSYMYDVLDNLVKITQGSQTRFFKYDSLSRLIREKPAEQIANSAYNLSDSLTGNSSWSRKLEYNSFGLLTRTNDARGVQADYSYDALNRLTLIDYSDSTPDAHYYYDSQTLPTGAPTYDHGYANGRLIAMTYGSSTSNAGTYFGYDSMGRVDEQRQVTGSNTYSLSYTYNLAGLLSTETYPTGRVLTHSYDNAARLSQISDGMTTFTSSLSYAASGGLLSETWGNGAVHSVAYNNARQVSQIKLKQSSTGSELHRFDYLYGQVTQSNGSVDKSKNNGQIGRIDGIINGSSTKEWEQRFSYDELGRLATAAEYQQGTGSTPSWKQEFTYDRYGNRFQSGSGNIGVGFTTVVANDISASTNRFISTGSTPMTYDAAGNITQDKKFRIDPQGDGMTYAYDANGRQITAAGTDEIGTQTSVYDCVGQRVQTAGNNITRQMVYDIFGQLVADYKGGSPERENIYRGGQILAVYEAASTCYKSIDQFIKDSYQGALGRQPNSTELSNWTTILTQAQARGGRALIGAAQELGNTLFTSTEYSNSNTDEQFVTDLYEAFLQRAPDSSGLSFWTSQVQPNGRSNVRLAFAVCPEFAENVAALCPGTSSSTSTSANLKYVLTDLQGSTRALMNNSGSGTSIIVSRHDYLPFGEEIWAGVGLRTATQKYSVTNKARQRFAQTERDEATGLDHTAFRKYDSFAGRWTTPDPLAGHLADPQSFNRFSYSANDPTNLIDPVGLDPDDVPIGPCPQGDCVVNVPIPPDDTPIGPGRGAGPILGDTNFVPVDPPSEEPPTDPGTEPADPEPPAGNDALTAEIIRRLAQCVKDIYGVTFRSIQASTPNTLGIFQGFGRELFRRTGGDNTPLIIMTNSSSFSSDQLRIMNNDYASRNPSHPRAAPGRLVLGATFGFGMAGLVSVTPYTNYLPNNPPADFSSNYSYLRRQIHELGHSLSTITGKGALERGKQLEDCVYGKPFTFG